jgi:predicted CoA-substrate-specific enzyme activase
VTVTAGLDLGSTYVKCVVMRDKDVLGHAVLPTGHDHDATAGRTLDQALAMGGLRKEDVEYTVSTGYGRRVASTADSTVSEISANAAGTRWVGREMGVRTIIDIGGQDTKVIALDDDLQITNFQMNDKCAAGTGRFLEVLARVLEIPLDDLGPVSLTSSDPVPITTTCLVFAKSEVATLITEGHAKEDIVAGIHKAVARRLTSMAKKVGVKEAVFFDGGPARNVGMIRALEKELGVSLAVPPIPQIVTATGAALLAQERLAEERAKGAS